MTRSDRGWLLVGRVAVAGEQATDGGAHPGTYLFLLAPVNGGVAAHRVDELAGDLLQQLVAHLQHGGVVLTDRVVEGQFVLAQPEFGTALVFMPQLFGQLD